MDNQDVTYFYSISHTGFDFKFWQWALTEKLAKKALKRKLIALKTTIPDDGPHHGDDKKVFMLTFIADWAVMKELAISIARKVDNADPIKIDQRKFPSGIVMF